MLQDFWMYNLFGDEDGIFAGSPKRRHWPTASSRVLIRTVWIVLLMIGAVYADWRETREIRLKKDVTQKIMVITEGNRRLLTFRWTLYQNKGLVIHRSFDGFVAQNVLALNHNNQSFRVEFSSKAQRHASFVYMLSNSKPLILRKMRPYSNFFCVMTMKRSS